METFLIRVVGISPNANESKTRNNLSKIFKATPEQIDHILAKPGFVIKRGLSHSDIEKYRIAIEKAGALCSVESESQPVETLEIDLPIGESIQQGNGGQKFSMPSSNVHISEIGAKLVTQKVAPSSWFKLIRSIASFIFLLSIIYFGYIFVKHEILKNDMNGSLTKALSSSGAADSSVNELYEFWHIHNKPEPGVYSDELIDGEVLFECKAEGKYPGKFGWLKLRMTFNQMAMKNSKPFYMYVGGIDYGTKRMAFGPQQSDTGGSGIIGRLELAGCDIPVDLRDRAKASLSSRKDAKENE